MDPMGYIKHDYINLPISRVTIRHEGAWFLGQQITDTKSPRGKWVTFGVAKALL